MPLARSHFRNRSRSPAPNTLPSSAFTTISQRSPVFYPPSHYAAAAGLARPEPFMPETPNPHQPREQVAQTSPSFTPASPLSYPTRTPVVQPVGAEQRPPQSTSHLNRMSRFIARSPSRSSPKSPRRNSTKASDRQKIMDDLNTSNGTLVDLPLVEMQLIPTLRDTIDKMTHPSPVQREESETESMDSGTYARLQASRIPGGGRRASVWTDDARSPVGLSFRTDAAYSPSPTPPDLPNPHGMSFKPAIPARVAARPRPLEEASAKAEPTPRTTSRIFASPKPALKSALRTPIPGPSAILEERMPDRKSLRTTRPVVLDPETPSLPQGSRTEDEHLEGYRNAPPRARSRTSGDQPVPSRAVVSHLPVPKFKMKSNPATPQQPSRPSSGKSQPPNLPLPIQTRIPPPTNSRSNLPKPGHSSVYTRDSGSESESRAKPTRLGGVIVDNVRDILSSSGSEERERSKGGPANRMRMFSAQERPPATSGIPVCGTRYGRSAAQHTQDILDPSNRTRQPVGLGFRMTPAPDTSKPHHSAEEDVESVYDEDDAQDDSSVEEDLYRREAQLGGRVTPEMSMRARLLDAVQHDETDVTTDGSQRRQATLVGLVDSLRAKYSMTLVDGSRTLPHSSENDAYLNQGIVVAESYADRDVVAVSQGDLPLVKEQRMQEELSLSPEESIYSEDDAESGYSSDAAGPAVEASQTPRWGWNRRQIDASSRGGSATLPPKLHSPHLISNFAPETYTSANDQPPFRLGEQPPSSPRAGAEKRTSAWIKRSSCISHSPSADSSASESAESRLPPSDQASKRTSRYGGKGGESSRSPQVSYAGEREGGLAGNVVERGRPVEREWEAFGIPRSLSYGAGDTSTGSHSGSDDPDSRAALLRSESDDSLDGNELHASLSQQQDDWNEGGIQGDLSQGASALFQTLATPTQRSVDYHDDDQWGERDRFVKQRVVPAHTPSALPHMQGISSQSPRPSSPATGERRLRERSRSPLPATPTGWRSTFPQTTFNELLAHYGHVEMQRQEVIYELLITENAIVKRFRAIVQSFFLPLRNSNSRTWLPGVPQEVARLFDWFEDIVNMHAEMERTLRTAARIWEEGSVVEQVAEPLLHVIPKLEVYQPYLVREEEVREMIADWVQDAQNEFGEYVRMNRELHGEEWSLEKLLGEPVIRLAAYSDMFERLLTVTPEEHIDYLATTSLLHTTKTVVHVMQEVRAREEEYDFVKAVTLQVLGLPDKTSLARRERRLLHYGPILWLRSAADEHGNTTPIAPAVQLNGKTLIRSVSRSERSNEDAAQQGEARVYQLVHILLVIPALLPYYFIKHDAQQRSAAERC
ncbi:hypothetical protein IEO21_04765 [Rhodonia placenta]|uniref:DH domain-containing protein n=1 Tax=Rhodonia placenta TaxID=104341 RepID=A0A8H7P3K2_9APHY|nr:hypothetical protein IEO21_04765 [Postia placenta]